MKWAALVACFLVACGGGGVEERSLQDVCIELAGPACERYVECGGRLSEYDCQTVYVYSCDDFTGQVFFGDAEEDALELCKDAFSDFSCTESKQIKHPDVCDGVKYGQER